MKPTDEQYTVRTAHLLCHPETCNHPGDWVLCCEGEIMDFYDDHDEAIKVCDELNGKRPTTPAWNGEGLPPVGCECEVKWDDGRESWHHGTVLCPHSRDKGVMAAVLHHEPHEDRLVWADKFRPLRTPEQRLREELEDLMKGNDFFVPSWIRGRLADAILAKYELKERE